MLTAIYHQPKSSPPHRRLRKTIRKKGSRLVFSWNPTDENAAIEKFRLINLDHALGAVERNTHYFNNPWCPPSLIAGAELLKEKDYEKYLYNEKKEEEKMIDQIVTFNKNNTK